jgi:predicted ribosome quality control (RQC) complex YloA/Tae2 family protein
MVYHVHLDYPSLAMSAQVPFKPFHSLEIATLVAGLVRHLGGDSEGNLAHTGITLDRWYVPERPEHPDGFFKGEWALTLSTRKQSGTLLISVRPQKPYLYWIDGKGPKAASGTRSPFDLETSKIVCGTRLQRIYAIPNERAVFLDFQVAGALKSLALVLIPALPEALLLDSERTILARSRTIRDANPPARFELPPLAQKTLTFENRTWIHSGLDGVRRELEQALLNECVELRKRQLASHYKTRKLVLKRRIDDNSRALERALAEPNWQQYGDLLKANLHNPPALIKNKESAKRIVETYDLETGEPQVLSIPCDPSLEIKEQIQKFYHQSKRNQRRKEEAKDRMELATRSLQELERSEERLQRAVAATELRELEQPLGIVIPAPAAPSGDKKRRLGFNGRIFVSRDGMPIWVGKSRDENLELTFKHARGNDLWLHLKGRPGAHVVIPLHSGKSAPLETLLDAAHLCIYYSMNSKNNQSLPKSEVDYTPKKHVKRIKNSTEASYTHNKTLIIDPDSARLKRLLSQEE